MQAASTLERHLPRLATRMRHTGANCLLHWHLCSLDAPTVAVVWAAALVHLVGGRLSVPEAAVLALGAWIVYVLDRLLDVLHVGRPLQERHHFHRRHRAALLTLCCIAALGVAFFCFQLPGALVELYITLGLPVIVYGWWVHGHRGQGRRQGPSASSGKEVAVAVLFTAAVAAPAWVLAGRQPRQALFAACLLLALLCWLNCASITHAESIARLSPLPLRQAGGRRRLLLISCAAALAVLAVCDAVMTKEPLPAEAVLLASFLFIALLGSLSAQAQARRFRVLADLALLTPLLFAFSRG